MNAYKHKLLKYSFECLKHAMQYNVLLDAIFVN